jgi:hypothetical protein
MRLPGARLASAGHGETTWSRGALANNWRTGRRHPTPWLGHAEPWCESEQTSEAPSTHEHIPVATLPEGMSRGSPGCLPPSSGTATPSSPARGTGAPRSLTTAWVPGDVGSRSLVRPRERYRADAPEQARPDALRPERSPRLGRLEPAFVCLEKAAAACPGSRCPLPAAASAASGGSPTRQSSHRASSRPRRTHHHAIRPRSD